MLVNGFLFILSYTNGLKWLTSELPIERDWEFLYIKRDKRNGLPPNPIEQLRQGIPALEFSIEENKWIGEIVEFKFISTFIIVMKPRKIIFTILFAISIFVALAIKIMSTQLVGSDKSANLIFGISYTNYPSYCYRYWYFI